MVSFSMPACRAAAALLALVVCSACSDEQTSATLPEPDGESFAQDVYPVLLRDCGSPACHGASARFFQIFGPGRARMSSEQAPLDLATPQEILESYRRTRGMLEHDTDGLPLLLRKPLELRAGGASHGGRDAYGRNVYASKEAPNYRVLERWATGEGAP
ncbi:MAG TPA: hypothetical protein VFN67_17145 [Polyangiales bacterium]|nr:hypothetical protein [Polyangiales bacterium]